MAQIVDMAYEVASKFKCIPTECDPKLYEAAGKEFIRTLCENVYTSKNMNLKDKFNEIIRDSVLKSLDDTSTPSNGKSVSEEIRGIIIGDDSTSGLKKYIQDLFIFSADSTDDKIYSFTSRVLQGLFKKEDRVIPEILSQAIIELRGPTVPRSKEVLEKMSEILKNRLYKPDMPDVKIGGGLADTIGASLRSNTVSQGNPESEKPNIPSSNLLNLNQTCAKLEAEKKEKSDNFNKLNEDNTNISEKDAKILNEIYDKLKSEANQSQVFLINKIVLSNDFGKLIQENILKALTKLFERSKESIYEKITESIIQKFTNKFVEDGTIQLLILYSILSYEKTGDSRPDNTFSIAHEIFEKAIDKTIQQMIPSDNNPDFSTVKDETIKNMSYGDNGETYGIMFQLRSNLFDNIASTATPINPTSRVLNEVNKMVAGKKSKKGKTKKGKSTKKSKSKKTTQKSKSKKSAEKIKKRKIKIQ
jgi:hypothetical protein